jgi:hypothetical protein
MVLYSWSKLYRQPAIYYYSLAPIFTNTAAQCDVYYLPPVAHSGNYFTGPLGTGRKEP